jgi:peptidoglycan/xylan/chitin deacetylase (PgdA/CDA1 family)
MNLSCFRWAFRCLVFGLLLLFPCLPQAEEENVSNGTVVPPVSNLTFGSERILSSCWTTQELRGKAEKKSTQAFALSLSPGTMSSTLPRHTHQPLAPALENSIRRVKPTANKKVVALTFDLCEGARELAGYDADIVNYLRDHRVKATFFAGGKWMLSHPQEAMQLIADPLFEVGNHSWTHANLRLLDAKRIEKQILRPQAQYEALWEQLQARAVEKQVAPDEMNKIPRVPRVFRFPYGTCNAQALTLLKRNGLAAIQWDVVTGDAAHGQTARAIARIVLQQVKPGSIVICHANGRGHGTAASLPLFIPKLRALGYEWVTVSELLTYGPAVASSECYELKPGDNFRYDKMPGARGE